MYIGVDGAPPQAGVLGGLLWQLAPSHSSLAEN